MNIIINLKAGEIRSIVLNDSFNYAKVGNEVACSKGGISLYDTIRNNANNESPGIPTEI